MKQLITIVLFAFLFVLTGCFKDVDFKQLEDVKLTPAHVVSLLNFKLPQTDLQDTNQLLTISKEVVIPRIDSEIAKNSLTKLLLQFKINNTFDRDVRLTFNLTDANGQETYKPIVVDVKEKQTDVSVSEEINITNHPDFLNTEKVGLTLTIQPNPNAPNNNGAQGNLFVFQSAVTLFFTTK